MHASKLMAVAVISLFVVGACAGSGGTPAPSATTAPTRGTADPCTLLTRADIKTAIGIDYGPSFADDYGHRRWVAGTGTVDEGKGMVTVSFASAGATLASVKAKSFGGADLTVRGHPVYWDAFAGGPSLWVDLGTSVLVVGLDPLPTGGQAMVQHLAELAIAKL